MGSAVRHPLAPVPLLQPAAHEAVQGVVERLHLAPTAARPGRPPPLAGRRSRSATAPPGRRSPALARPRWPGRRGACSRGAWPPPRRASRPRRRGARPSRGSSAWSARGPRGIAAGRAAVGPAPLALAVGALQARRQGGQRRPARRVARRGERGRAAQELQGPGRGPVLALHGEETKRALDGPRLVGHHLLGGPGRQALGVVGDVRLVDPVGRGLPHQEALQLGVHLGHEGAGAGGRGRLERRRARARGGAAGAAGAAAATDRAKATSAGASMCGRSLRPAVAIRKQFRLGFDPASRPASWPLTLAATRPRCPWPPPPGGPGAPRPGSSRRRSCRRPRCPEGRAANQPSSRDDLEAADRGAVARGAGQLGQDGLAGQLGRRDRPRARASSAPPSAPAWPARRCAS